MFVAWRDMSLRCGQRKGQPLSVCIRGMQTIWIVDLGGRALFIKVYCMTKEVKQ